MKKIKYFLGFFVSIVVLFIYYFKFIKSNIQDFKLNLQGISYQIIEEKVDKKRDFLTETIIILVKNDINTFIAKNNLKWKNLPNISLPLWVLNYSKNINGLYFLKETENEYYLIMIDLDKNIVIMHQFKYQ